MKPIAMTIADAVKLSGLSRSSLYLAFKEKRIVPRKSGKRTLILTADLEKFLGELPEMTDV